MKYALPLSALFLFSFQLSAQSKCPAWIKNLPAETPLCPPSQLVPENYPVAFVTIADEGMSRHNGSEFTADVVEKVLKGAGPQTPGILLPVSDKTMTLIRARIDQSNVSAEQKRRWKESLFKVDAAPYTWQQDYMQAGVNPTTGQIINRRIANRTTKSNFDAIQKILSECGVAQGRELGDEDYDDRPGGYATGESGGNIETLPFGICLLGDDYFRGNEWADFADEVCEKGEDNRIKVPTYWLGVGHTDEIVKVVRNRRGKAPCDFSVAIANVDRGLELLKKSPSEKFLSFPDDGDETGTQKLQRRFKEIPELSNLCMHWNSFQKSKGNSMPAPKKSKTTTMHDFIKGTFLETAWAESKQGCEDLTNGDVYRLFTEYPELVHYNRLIAEQMNALRAEIQAKVAKKNPSCKKVDFIDLPYLFGGGEQVTVDGKPELTRSFGASFLPNPSNSISINNTLISPDPGNKTFRDDIALSYSARGLKPEFADTFDYAHKGAGNLHCVTNTIHACRGRGAK